MNRQSKDLPASHLFGEIWRGFAAGNEESFKALFYRFHPPMCEYGLRICRDEELVRDGIQELFLRLWRDREKLPSRVVYVKAYLFRILRNDLLKRIRERDRLNSFSGPDPAGEDAQVIFSPEDVMTQSEALRIRSAALSKALNRLPPREREVIWLKFYEELDYREIADVMEISYQSVMNYLHQGFHRLRKDPAIKKAAETTILMIAFLNS